VDLPLTAPGVARALAGAALHLAVVAALGVAAGWLLRSTVAAVAAVLSLYYVLPVLGFLLPDAAAGVVLRWLPGSAAAGLMDPASANSWTAAVALIIYAGGAVLLAVAVMRRRDI
jgi:ABC-2 type transport system permease protein